MQKRDLLLVQLMQESSEVVQACSKALLHGLEKPHSHGRITNGTHINKKLNAVHALAKMLHADGAITYIHNSTLVSEKQRKVHRYLEDSHYDGRIVLPTNDLRANIDIENETIDSVEMATGLRNLLKHHLYGHDEDRRISRLSEFSYSHSRKIRNFGDGARTELRRVCDLYLIKLQP